MKELLKQFKNTLLESTTNLIPILVIIAGFQLLVFQTIPENILSISVGFLIVILGVTFFLMGLEIGIFPLGNQLSSEFLERNSLFGSLSLDLPWALAPPSLSLPSSLWPRRQVQSHKDHLTLSP